ncbi:hypothetical protein [Parablautia sp. Marseille-Q6255]|uniref:hypothetical protein n=1 Tax=Parablautia sp. Marseille-Q6255 TaxID=3039593 RepID=UPI0024BC89F1|nr:hypothetical protein [Parablautia sp. Marseille-Q6255]
MARYELVVEEKVTHQHSLIIECDSMAEAQGIAEEMEDENIYHTDDIVVAAKSVGAKVVEFNEDYFVNTDYIEIDEINEVKED